MTFKLKSFILLAIIVIQLRNFKLILISIPIFGKSSIKLPLLINKTLYTFWSW